MYCDPLTIGTWGPPSPPKTCWRLKWMVPNAIESQFWNWTGRWTEIAKGVDETHLSRRDKTWCSNMHSTLSTTLQIHVFINSSVQKLQFFHCVLIPIYFRFFWHSICFFGIQFVYNSSGSPTYCTDWNTVLSCVPISKVYICSVHIS